MPGGQTGGAGAALYYSRRVIQTRLRGAVLTGSFAVLAAVAMLLAIADQAHAAEGERPIVYAVVIDGLDGDAVDAGEAPFISSLLDGAAGANVQYYEESRSVMVAETNPNHTAMMTGAYTDRSGVAGNSFAIYSHLEGEDDNEAETCVASGPRDPRSLPTETSGEDASCIEGETVFQAIKRQGNPDELTTAGVFGKAKLGRLFGGKNKRGKRFVDHIWAPCTPSDGPDEESYCGNVPIEPINQDRTVSDTFVMDEVLRTVRQGVGPDAVRPDFTFVNLPNVDNAGHALGGGSLLYDQSIGLADAEIERLVNELQARGEWERTVLVILSDHSHESTPASVTVTSALEDAGISGDDFLVIDNGSVDMLYLADRKAEDRFELLKRMREVIEGLPGVDQALYRRPNPADGGEAHTIDGAQPDWHAAGPRTGDLFITADAATRFSDPSSTSNPLPGNHGSWVTRDNTFMVAGGGELVADLNRAGTAGERFSDTEQNPMQAENVDLADTVLGAFGLFPTRSDRGRYLDEALVEGALPGGARSTIQPVLRLERYSKRGRLERFFASWGPAGARKPRVSGGTWTLQLRRRGGSWKTLIDDRAKQARRIKVGRRGRFQVRVRGRVASGDLTSWTKRPLG